MAPPDSAGPTVAGAYSAYTNEAPGAAPAPAEEPSTSRKVRTWLERRFAMLVVLTVLTTVGLFLTDIRPQHALWYWSAMFPAFGLVSTWQELATGRRDSILPMLVRQVLHWGGPIVAVRILFLQLARGQMDASAVGMTTLLLLCLTCFLAAVHFSPSFFWVALLLAIGVVLGTEIETYLWVLVAVSVLAIAAVVAVLVLRRRATSAAEPVPGPV